MTTLPADVPQGYPIPWAYESRADFLRDWEAWLESQQPAQEKRQCQH